MQSSTVNPMDISTRFIVAMSTLRRMKRFDTKKEFCQAICMPPQNLHPIETGRNGASITNICNLVKVYDVNPIWLFTGSGDMFLADGEC